MKKNREGPRLPPVDPSLVSKKLLPSVAAAVVFLVVGVSFLAVGVAQLFQSEPGWQEIVDETGQRSCSAEFTLMYDVGSGGADATSEYKALSQLYVQAARDAYHLFSAQDDQEGLHNVAYLNAHLNEAVEVDPGLYKALAQVAASEDRHAFLAPAMVEYRRVFQSPNDLEARLYDPACNEDTRAWLQVLARYADDPRMIRLEDLGENTVRLTVSPEYLAFLEENEYETVLDFDWMKNAFIADYLADTLTQAGYTQGYLSSYDGFTRNLDQRGMSYSLNLLDREGTQLRSPAVFRYTAPASLVYLRDYPVAEEDRWHYYVYESGQVVTAMLDSADARSKSAVHTLLAYSQDLGCGAILLRTADLFTAEALDAQALNALTREQIDAVWLAGKRIFRSDPAAAVALQDEAYTLE